MSKIFEIYQAVASADEIGHLRTLGYYTREDTASILSDKKGFYGASHNPLKRLAAKIDGKYYLVDGPIDLDGNEAKAKQKILNRVMAKLSELEKEVLFESAKKTLDKI